MTSVDPASGNPKRHGETATALDLSQPRVTGTGSSRTFANPWPEWQVCTLIKAAAESQAVRGGG